MKKTKKQSAVSSQQSVVGTSRRLVRSAANYAIARRKLEQSAKKQPRRLCGSDLPVAPGLRRLCGSDLPVATGPRRLCGSDLPVAPGPRRLCGSDLPVATGPRTRDQHLSALSAKIDATHKSLVTVATGIVNLKKKLHRLEELYRTLAHNYGARTAEHTRQIIETTAINQKAA